jgi:hypothetical protein
MPTLEEAIGHIRMGNREHGRQILEEILEKDETNENVWLWLSAAVDSNEDREICLENVLALNPDNIIAQRGLDALQSGTFNPNDLLADVLDLDQEEEEAEKQESTFLDEFVMAGDEEEELEFPSSMRDSKPRKAKKGGRGLNVRLIILVALGIGAVLVLGAIAAFSIFMGGDGATTDQPTDTPAVQQQEQPAEPTATDTPEPTATATNTPTPRPRLTLPAPTPTREPSPTATRVVSPTPSR